MELEWLIPSEGGGDAFSCPLAAPAGVARSTDPWMVDWGPMLHGLLAGLRGGEPAGMLSRMFHNGLVDQ